MDAESSVSKWGNSLAIRIPAAIAQEWGVREGERIEIIQRDGEVVLWKKTYDLATLLSHITEDNLHGEIDTGPPVGKEVW